MSNENELDDFLKELETNGEGEINPSTNPFGLHMVQLLVVAPMKVEAETMLAALRKRCGENVEDMGGVEETLMFAHMDHVSQFDEGAIPAQTVVWLPVSGEPLAASQWEADLQQTYDWNRDEARAACEKHRGVILLTDMMAVGLPHQERMQLYHNSVLSLLDVLGDDCVALRWMRSGVIVNPKNYRASKEPGERFDPIYPAVNVRLFNITNGATKETMVMDTLGMTAFNIPDLQIHFRGLEPGRVAGFLKGISHYLFDNGDVIEDGNTIQGFGDGDLRWRCQLEMSLIAPEREVLDVNPGGSNVAGNRS